MSFRVTLTPTGKRKRVPVDSQNIRPRLYALPGRTGGDQLTVNGSLAISLDEIKHAHARWLPEFMSAP